MQRRNIIRFAISGLSVPFVVVLYLNIEKLAEARGLDTLLVDLLSPDDPKKMTVGSQILNYATSPEVAGISILVIGIVIGFWSEVLLRRGDGREELKWQGVGRRCERVVMMIESIARTRYYSEDDSPFKQPAVLNRIWAAFLPVAVDLERLGLSVPDHGVDSQDDAIRIREYLRFVGPLVAQGHIRAAKDTAKSLLSDSSRPPGHSRIRRLRGIAQKIRRIILPG